MKEFKIVHEETLVGHYYVEAETPEAAITKWQRQVANGEIDFGDMSLVDSNDTVEEMIGNG